MKKRYGYRLVAGLSALMLLLLAACASEPAESSDVESVTESAAESVADTSEDDGIFDIGDDVFGEDTTTAPSAEDTTTAPSTENTGTSKVEQPTTTTQKKTTTTTKKGTATTSPLTDSNTQNTDKKHAANLPKMDLKNKTVTILRNTAITESTLAKEAYGLTLDVTIVDSSTLLTRFVTMASSDNCPDMYWSDFNSQLIARKYVQAWDTYVDISSDLWKGNKASLDVWKVGGKHYYLFPQQGISGYTLYNKEIFDEYNVQYPSKLFAQGKWNWTAMQQFVEKLTIDNNKDGVPEIYGLFSDLGPFLWVQSTGHDYVSIENGTPKNLMLSENVSRAMSAWMKVVDTKGYIHDTGEEIEAFLRGEVAMYSMITSNILYREDVIKGIEEGRYDFTAIPKDPQADKHYTAGTTAGYFLPKNSKNPEGAVAYMNVLRYQVSNKGYLADTRKELLDKGVGFTQAMYDTMDDIQSKVTPVQDTWNHMGQEFLSCVTGPGGELLKGKSWAQVSAEYSPRVDAIIKNYMNNTNL